MFGITNLGVMPDVLTLDYIKMSKQKPHESLWYLFADTFAFELLSYVCVTVIYACKTEFH